MVLQTQIHNYVIIIFTLHHYKHDHSRFKSVSLPFKRQDLQMFGLKLNKHCMWNFHPLEVQVGGHLNSIISRFKTIRVKARYRPAQERTRRL